LLYKNIKVKMYSTIILTFVLYGCETWSLTVSEEHTLRVSGNRVVRKIFGPMRDEVRGEWRRLHNETFYDLYLTKYLSLKIKKNEMVGVCGNKGKRRGAYRILVGRPLGRPWHRWWDDIKMDLQEVGCKALTRLIWLMIGTGWRFL
jgi:hypothetical protein